MADRQAGREGDIRQETRTRWSPWRHTTGQVSSVTSDLDYCYGLNCAPHPGFLCWSPNSHVMVNFTCQFDWPWSAQMKHYFWICLWRCFQMQLAFEWVDSAKSMTPPFERMGGFIQSAEALNTTKSRRRKDCAWAGTPAFSCPCTKSDMINSPGSQSSFPLLWKFDTTQHPDSLKELSICLLNSVISPPKENLDAKR